MKIILAEDDSSIRRGIELFLNNQGHNVHSADNGCKAFELIQKIKPDIIISDIQMPGITGLELLAKIKDAHIEIPIIIITSFATVKNAVTALKQGAADFLTKPLDLEELKMKLEKIAGHLKLLDENRLLKTKLNQYENPDLIGESRPMQQVQEMINRVAADSDIPVVIYGESGTGKELAARAIHNRGERASNSFIAVNCASFPEELLESELFGHRKGAFTGAIRDKKGFFKTADKGTLFLDELSEMSPRMQAKLLRTLQDGSIQPLGTTTPEKINVRIIGASNRNLKDMIQAGSFREDLYYRINVMEIQLPPLRERRGDIPLLINYFIDKHNKTGYLPRLSKQALSTVMAYFWPGNVRELENLIRRLLVTCNDGEITENDLPQTFINQDPSQTTDFNLLDNRDLKNVLHLISSKFEREYISHHLKINGGNISKTAESIGLSRVALHKKIKLYQIDVSQK